MRGKRGCGGGVRKTISAIQHRFIDPSLEKGERYTLKPGSEPILFDLHEGKVKDLVEDNERADQLRASEEEAD